MGFVISFFVHLSMGFTIRTDQKGSRDNLIYKLSLLGYNTYEIAEKVELEQPRIVQINKNLKNFRNLLKSEFITTK